MRLLPLLVSQWILSTCVAVQHGYNEHLELRPLPGHHLHAQFTFTSTIPRDEYDARHFRHFPRSLAQILQQTHTAELHLRFALGRWDDEWGARPRNGTREGGTGVELWAWIEGDAQDEVDQRWSALVNGLSGQFCASLNFIDSTRTTQPVLSFDPEGIHGDSLHIMHGLLPREVVCTENLTPFLKMLPCKGKAGISSLLDGHKVFDASWQSMSIDVRPLGRHLEIEQSISMALSLPRSMRDRHDPIPRPPPIEEVECDESKSYNSHDTCLPKTFNGQMAWNLTRVFGRSIQGGCGSHSAVSLHVPAAREVSSPQSGTVDADVRAYILTTDDDFDLNLTKQDDAAMSKLATPPLYVSRQLTGYGQQQGGMHTVIRNPHDRAQDIVYFESLPWYLRPFMHTLAVSGGRIDKMYYTPLIDRKRGTHLELQLHIPAQSTLILEYDVEKAILRYTEYPPDANRGFDIGSAVIRVLSNDSHDQYIRTTGLLLPLPTPDFSMPYNVIILTSTVIALGFGSIFNLLARRFVLAEEVPQSPLAARLQALLQAVRRKIKSMTGETKPVGEQTGSRSTEKVKQSELRPPDRQAMEDPSVNGSTRRRKAQ